MAAISYDSQAILKVFAERKGITYPLLSDPESKIIRAFGILNTNVPPQSPGYGICFPGTYIVDQYGRVLSKYFEEGHRQRYTADTILTKEFGTAGGHKVEVRAPHLRLDAFATQDTIRPGNRIMVVLDVHLAPGIHVYAPAAEGYRPVRLEIPTNSTLWAHQVTFPEPEILYLPAIQEKVPVYQGNFRLTRDVTLSPRYREKSLSIPVQFEYQACDEKICYPPRKVSIELQLAVEHHDLERSPESLRHKPKQATGN